MRLHHFRLIGQWTQLCPTECYRRRRRRMTTSVIHSQIFTVVSRDVRQLCCCVGRRQLVIALQRMFAQIYRELLEESCCQLDKQAEAASIACVFPLDPGANFCHTLRYLWDVTLLAGSHFVINFSKDSSTFPVSL